MNPRAETLIHVSGDAIVSVENWYRACGLADGPQLGQVSQRGQEAKSVLVHGSYSAGKTAAAASPRVGKGRGRG